MKFTIITVLTLSFAAISITAQPQRGAARVAKPTVDSRPTQPLADGGARSTRNGSKPTGQQMSATQQQNINKLASDLSAIKQGSQVTTEQKQALKNDLMAMADGATKPDQALVQQLANDLSAAMSDGTIDNKEKAKLSNDLYLVMNSANIPMDEVNQAIADAKVILEASGVAKADVQTIVADLKAIGTEAKNNAPNGGAKAQTLKGKLKRN